MFQRCFCLEGGNCIFPDGIRQESVYVCNGRICPPVTDAVRIDCGGLYVAPGLIDLQVNGVAGLDFTASPELISEAELALACLGTTFFLPTIISQPLEYYQKLPALDRIHYEGPFLHRQYAGAHDPACLQLNCVDIYANATMVTLAPELDGALDLIEQLRKRGVLVSCGHSGATAAIMKAAEKRGLQMVTHLFNAMRPFHHRTPSIIDYTLSTRSLYYSLIVDGVHVSREAVLLAYNAHPTGLILVSDSSALLGAESGTLGARALDATGPYLAGSTTLAGSRSSLFDCMKRLSEYTGSLYEAMCAASFRPAELLGLKNKGSLLSGMDADIIVFTKAFELKEVFKAGKPVLGGI